MPISLKDRIRGHLEAGDLEAIEAVALERRRTLGTLLALTFEADPQTVWRAIEAMGIAGEALSRGSPAYVKEHMRRLYWLITEESGGVFWRAPECMAELAARMPRLLASHIPIAFHLIETLEEEDLEHFRPGALWAVGRLFYLASEYLPDVLPLVVSALADPRPQSRGMAVWCLKRVGKGDILEQHPRLLEDEGPVEVYEDRALEETTVGALTRRYLAAAAS